jgi:hypothetical protein
MPDFLVSINTDGEQLKVHARRADGEIRDFKVPLRVLKLFNLTREVIDYVTGGKTGD